MQWRPLRGLEYALIGHPKLTQDRPLRGQENAPIGHPGLTQSRPRSGMESTPIDYCWTTSRPSGWVGTISRPGRVASGRENAVTTVRY
jgi:hypothetical protein